MTDKQIIKVSKGFTKGILGNWDTTDKCFIVCAPLCAYLELLGVKAELVEGQLEINGDTYHHFWIRCGNKIIDPTGDQFPESKSIWMEEIPAHYKPIGQNTDQKVKEVV